MTADNGDISLSITGTATVIGGGNIRTFSAGQEVYQTFNLTNISPTDKFKILVCEG